MTMETAPRLGIQLYTVRELTDDGQFRDTLTKLARLGFEGVEFAWKYGGMSPTELADFLASQGLTCCGIFARSLADLLDSGHATYAYAHALKSPFVTASVSGREAEWDALLPQLNLAGRIAADHGLQFTYHNHWQEFDGPPGHSSYDRLLRETDPELVKLELDLGWTRKGGWEPMELWNRLGPRIRQIHLRDYDEGAGQICDIGDGFIDPPQVFAQARKLGVPWLIFEQDRYPVSPLASCQVCTERCTAART
jgi:sugar phosphate isomerase/epimerase